MRTLNPEIPLQKELARQIYQALQGDVVSVIARDYRGRSEVSLHSDKRAHSLPVTEAVLPELYALCQDVKQRLEFDEPVDFYITGTADVNAFAIGSDDPEVPHIVEINSALFNLMNEDELRYIIGHELGHLINRDSVVGNLFRYVYPTDEARANVPYFLSQRYEFWSRIAELSADRYGYMACENLDACVTAIFKLASGLNLDKMNIRIADLMEINSQNLDFFMTENINIGGTHPVNPIRIQAIHLFAKAKTQKALNTGMEEMMGILTDTYFNELCYQIALFRAGAGLYICLDGGKLERREEELILNAIAPYELFPAKLLKKIMKDDYMVIMKQSMSNILTVMPGLRGDILGYLITVAFVDGIIEEGELSRIYELGEELGFSHHEISTELTEKIRCDLQPQAVLIK